MVLPFVPLLALLLVPDLQPSEWLDQLVVFIVAVTAAGVTAAAIAYVDGLRFVGAARYAVITAALCCLPITVVVLIAGSRSR